MNSKVALYDSHEKAIKAVEKLKEKGFPVNNISLIGKAEITDNHMHIKSMDAIERTPALIGAGAGTLVGILTGLGVFAIPGFGFLYGAGVIVGAIGGFDLGIIAGGLGSVLATVGIKDEHVLKYEEHLKEGKFMVLVSGSLEEIELAEHILHTEGTHLELE